MKSLVLIGTLLTLAAFGAAQDQPSQRDQPSALLLVVLETHGLLASPSRSGLQPPFPAGPIHCSAFRLSECLTSLADVMT